MKYTRQTFNILHFTIFEVTTVLAIMSILISIIYVALSRFNEQLKVANDITAEMNNWRMVRSTIWKDFYQADSIQCHENNLTIFTQGNQLEYKIVDDHLHRNKNGADVTLGFEVESIYEKREGDISTFYMDFPWKNEIMTLSYAYNPAIDLEINNYFELIK